MHVHAWAQADRFALALNFLWNGFDLFRAETYLMNLEFPNNFTYAKDNSVTMVNLPIHEYVIACIMKITGSTKPIIFRLYMLLWSFIALLSIKNIGKNLGLQKVNQLLFVVFAATSPIFVYYQANFLPSIPSLALSLIGVNLYIKYLSNNKASYFNYLVVCFTLAAIYRTTFIIPFIAICCVELIRIIRKESKILPKVLPLLLMATLFYIQRIHHYNQIHSEGSVFLYYLVPAQNLTDFKEFISLTIKNWKFDYLNVAQWSLFSILTITAVIGCRTKTQVRSKTKELFLLIAINCIGILLFLIAMTTKFPDHDYYYLDTLYIPLQLLVGLLILYTQHAFKNLSYRKYIYLSTLILFSISAITATNANLNYRLSSKYWDNSPETVATFIGGEAVLDSLQIVKESKLLILGNNFPNLPLILFNRKGYSIKAKSKELIKQSLQWDFDYIVIQNELYKTQIHSVYPDLINETKPVYQNSKYSILKLLKVKKATTLEEYFKDTEKPAIFSEMVDFESKPAIEWSNLNTTTSNYLNGKFSGLVTSEMEYGLTYKSNLIPFSKSQENSIKISGAVSFKNTAKELYAVVSISRNGERVFYQQENLISEQESSQWKTFSYNYSIPKFSDNNVEFAFYFWNPKKKEALIDNVKISLH